MEKSLEQFMTEQRLDRLDSVLDKRTDSLVIALENVHNYHNISAVIRSADAFGIQQVMMVGNNFEHSGGISLGAERWIDILQFPDSTKLIKHLKNNGYKIVVLQPEEFSESVNVSTVPVNALPFDQNLALVFGNERDGVSSQITESADLHAFIPMCGFVDSLNISVAAAICMSCASLSNTTEKRVLPALGKQRKEEVRAKWLRKGVKRSDLILREIQNRMETKIE